MSKFIEEMKKDIEGMEARHEQHKELRHEKHEEKKFARELKHQMKHEEHEKVKQGRKVDHEEKKEERHERHEEKKLEKELGIPVICTSARSGKGIEELKKMIVSVVNNKVSFSPNKTVFSQEIEEICNDFIKQTEHIIPEDIDRRYFAMEVLEGDEWFLNMIFIERTKRSSSLFSR